jgi:hypothetical protein
MAAAGKWKLYEQAKLKIAQGIIDLDTHSFKINLYLSTSNANDLTLANAFKADITNQVATNFGYTQDTKAVTITTAQASGTVTVDETTNPVWTASGGTITARFAVIYDDTNANKDAVCVCLLDTAPADVSATTGNTLTITQAAGGIFTMAGAAVD